MAERVRLSRKGGWSMPENTVRVARPGLFGNPFAHAESRVAVAMHRVWLTGGMRSTAMLDCRVVLPGDVTFRRRQVLRDLGWLRGKNLACWCRLDASCHADTLLELSNG
ncbi:DUF4326 domain-containing protein [Pararoseomonas sp. SCSIO 73927]|uniref:DUF4326 domain-containing protein n=1 Tax=Pararoseomonas sp. SCSIO 73927 TaxID=3114537 RepID=UPI0030D30442